MTVLCIVEDSLVTQESELEHSRGRESSKGPGSSSEEQATVVQGL